MSRSSARLPLIALEARRLNTPAPEAEVDVPKAEAEPSEERFFTLEQFMETIRKVVGEFLTKFKPELLYEFVLRDLENCWQTEVEIQRSFLPKAESEPDVATTEFRRGHVALCARVSEALSALFRVDGMLEEGRRKGVSIRVSGEEVGIAISLVSSWLNALRTPTPWPSQVIHAHSETGLRDRLAAELDIRRGTGIEINI